MNLYNFSKLSEKLDEVGYQAVTESRFQVVRTDFSDEETRGNISFKTDGIYLNINGVEHKGYMYIKVADVAQYGLPKFHISNCQTIIQQRTQNRFQGHYFWSNSNIVVVQQRGSTVLHKDVKLDLCNNCRSGAQISNYHDTQGFFNLLDIQTVEPQQNEEVDIFGYVKNWQQISRKTRIERDYTCEICKIKIEIKIDQRYIQVHHINGNKLNNTRENLMCVCVLCHANMDERHVNNFKVTHSLHEIRSFVEKYDSILKTSGNIYVQNFIKDNF